MTSLRNRTLVVLIAILGFSLLISQSVGAETTTQQGGNGFMVSPVRIEQTISQGQSAIIKLSIENPTTSDVNAKLVALDFEPSSDESGQPSIILDETKAAPGNSFKSLLGKIQPIFLKANERKTVQITLSVPKGASVGGYYGVIRVIPAEGNDTNRNVSLSASVGTIFLITVPGKLVEQLQFVDFSPAKNDSTGTFYTNSKGLQVITRLRNSGNVHVKPFGKVQIFDRSGKLIYEYEFNNTDPKSNVLPNSTRKYTDNIADQKMLGKYTLIANLGYGSTGDLITAKTTFWVIPIWLIASVSVLILLIVAGIYLIIRKFRNRR